jgi:HlyD family secretion protein
MTGRPVLRLLVPILALGALGYGGFRWVQGSAAIAEPSAPIVPTARITKGTLTPATYLQGDLRATKQASLTAPAVGGALRILSMKDTGTLVAPDDAVMEFDPADQQYALEQAQSELREAEQELIKRRAEIKAQEAQDKVALLTAQFDVRRATLDAAVDADLISANDYRIRQAELVEAKRNLEKLEQDISARQATSQASLKVLQEKKARSDLAAARAVQNMDNLLLRAPIGGIVSVRDNMDASGGMFYTGMVLPSYRAGDTVYSGRPVVDIFDLSRMEIRTRVNEQERANVAVGQAARVTVDAVPGAVETARVSAVAGLGQADRLGPLRQFDVTLELTSPDPRLKPGTTVKVVVQSDPVDDVLLLPRQALFEFDGKPTVYVQTGADTFVPKQIKVLHRTESQIAIEGVDEGMYVALVDPVAAMKLRGAAASGRGTLGPNK